jgi:acyl-CoA thioester hydrolase
VTLTSYRSTVPPEWIDYNGHMMDGYYAIAFSAATDALMDALGLDAAYRVATRCTIYTAEMHIVYLRELKEGAPLRFATQLLGHDAKRIHAFHSLYHETDDYLAATCELMLLHVDQAQGRVAAMPETIGARVAKMAREQAGLARPTQAGRVMGLHGGKRAESAAASLSADK